MSLHGGTNQASGPPAFWDKPGDYLFEVSHIESQETDDKKPMFLIVGKVTQHYDPASIMPVGSICAVIEIQSSHKMEKSFKNKVCVHLRELFRLEIPDDSSIDPQDMDYWTKWGQYGMDNPEAIAGRQLRFSVHSMVSKNGGKWTDYRYAGTWPPAE